MMTFLFGDRHRSRVQIPIFAHAFPLGNMGMSIQKDVAIPKERGMFRIHVVTMAGIDHPAIPIQQAIFRKNRKLQHHLVHLCIAVTPNADNGFLDAVEKGNHLFGVIFPRQIIAGTMIEDIPQQQKPVRLFLVEQIYQLTSVVHRTVNIGSNHEFHLFHPFPKKQNRLPIHSTGRRSF